MEISFVAPEGSEYQQMEAHFSLDGAPLAVPDDSRPGHRYLLFAGDLPPGAHRLKAELQYRRGEDSFFSRRTRAVVEVKGSADFTVEPGSHLRIVGRILQRSDPDHGADLPTFVVGMSRSGPPQAPAVAAEPPPAPVVEATQAPKSAPSVEAKRAPKAAPSVEAKRAPKDAPPVEAKPAPDHDRGTVEPAVAKQEPPRPKRHKKKKPPMTAMERLRARLRSGKHPKPASKPKSEPTRKEDPAVARLRELLRKSVHR